MATKDFAHLHVHTEYSMLDGAARLGDLFSYAKELGMSSMATSDHGFLFGAFDFWRQAKAHDIKPIIGVEAYLTPGTHRTDRSRVRWGDGSRDDVSGGGAYTHMTMWAETTEGMHNLFRASSIASLEGQLYKPRMDREVLQTYSKGLIATTGCPSGEIQTRLRLGQFDEALQAASDFRDIFGKDNFYCEVMDHGLDIERNVQEDLHRLAKQLNLPYVATNDLHYTRQEDHTAHAALLCVQSGSTPSASSSTRITSTCARPRRCTRSSAIFPAPARTPSRLPSAATWSSTPRRTTCRTSPCPRARTRNPGS